jgi:signal peptidase I
MNLGTTVVTVTGSRRLRLWGMVMLAAALVVVLRTQFLLAIIVGQSMLPTLEHGELLVVSRFAFRATEANRGDVVLARLGNEFLAKRVVGLPGEKVAVDRGALLIDGEPWPEQYIHPGPLTIPEATLSVGEFALLGDNRALPEDLAMHGIAPRTAILGKVILSVRFSNCFASFAGERVSSVPAPLESAP